MRKVIRWLVGNLRASAARDLNCLVMQETLSLRDGLQGTYWHELLVLRVAVARLKWEMAAALVFDD